MSDYVLHLGDCLEYMKTMPARSVDAVITDPPYGINAEKGTSGFGESKDTVRHYDDKWIKPGKEIFDQILTKSQSIFVFGGNYFTDSLPQSDAWLVWDKTGNIKFQNPFSDCELVWTTLTRKTVKKYTYILQGFIGAEKKRFHPTQKPVAIMKMLIEDFTKKGDTIFDPFMGSGTTGVAAVQLGRNFIGCEIDPKYFAIAEKRIHEATLQPQLFTEKREEEKQAELI